MKRVLVAGMLMVGGVALAVAIGQKLSADATAVVIGVSVGVLASIPTVLVVLVHRAPREQWPAPERYQKSQTPVNVVIVQQPAGQSEEPLFLPASQTTVVDLVQFQEDDYPVRWLDAAVLKR